MTESTIQSVTLTSATQHSAGKGTHVPGPRAVFEDEGCFTLQGVAGDILVSLSLSVLFCKILLQRVFARIKKNLAQT